MTTMERKLDLLMQYTIATDKKAKKKLLEEIASMVESDTPAPIEDNLDKLADDAIYTLLNEVGVPHSYYGREYIEYAIKLIVSDKDYIRHMTSRLYPDVASKFNATAKGVERCIRKGVETAYNRCITDDISRKIGVVINPRTGKTTSSEFLAGCAATIRKQLHIA